MRELKRIFLNPLHIGILLFFSLLSGFFFYYQQLERFPAPKQTGILYQKILEKYSSLTLIEAQQKAEEASGMYQALSLLLAVRDKDEYNRIRDNYESRYPELITQLESGNWNESNTASLLSAHEYLSEQIAYLNRYADYRKQIDENAENLQSSGLFSQPGTFRYENILKTKKDYQSMDASWLSIHPILDANAYQDSSGFFAICGIAYLAVFCFLLFEERRNHMWESIYASGNGRTKLIWIRITALSIGTFLFSFFTHSIRLSVSILLYGGLETTALVQEIAAYQECPYPISIGFCFLIQFLLQWFGLLIFGIAIAGICAWCANQSLAYVGIAVFLTIEYLLFSNLSDASSLAWLKYNNIFLSLHPKLLFAKYLNLPFGSVPVALTLIYGLFSGVLIVFGLSLFAFGLKWKRPSNPFQPWERLCMNLRKRFPMALRTGRPVFTEISKALLWRKGMAVLFLYGLTAYSLIRPVSLYENGKESALNFYYSETEGIFDAAVMDRYLTQAQAWINEGIQVTEDAF